MKSNKTIPGGLFITLEGIDSSGKSTQIIKLAEHLESLGYDVLTTREPGGTPLNEEIRRLVKQGVNGEGPCDIAELFLFSAARAQLTDSVILPHLKTGGIVLCDRYKDSTTVFQGYARGLDLDMIADVHKIATQDRGPDITILFDLDVKTSRMRRKIRDGKVQEDCRFENEELEFHEKVRQGYLSLANDNRNRFVVMAADKSIATVWEQLKCYMNMTIRRFSIQESNQ